VIRACTETVVAHFARFLPGKVHDLLEFCNLRRAIDGGYIYMAMLERASQGEGFDGAIKDSDYQG
jgi:hypothetical protein